MTARIAFVLFATLGFILAVAPALATTAEAAPAPTTCHVSAAHQWAICGGDACATINNTTNTARWITSDGKRHVAHYSDMGGARLTFDRPVPRAVQLAEAKLSKGKPGPKIARACTA